MRANRNLGYCTINSPVTGVIIDRRVNIGQTVVASLNAPSLFLLAKDLKKMEVWVAVNEADIGRIYEGQPVEFTVDAFPGREFKGAVSKIRLNASMTNNVVTYVVELSTDNPDELLLPYLTANVRFEIYRNTQALIVPNAALRWVPPEENISPSARNSAESTATPGHRAGPSTAKATTQPATDSDLRAATLWVKDGAFVRPIEVRAGNTDTIRTEVFGDTIHEGMEIVTGIVDPSQQGSGSASPFIPQIRRGGGRMR
jgi:HlyD family secretion protein